MNANMKMYGRKGMTGAAPLIAIVIVIALLVSLSSFAAFAEQPQKVDGNITLKDSHGRSVSANVTILDKSGTVVKSHGQAKKLDKGRYNAEIEFANGPIKKIRLNNLNVSSDTLELRTESLNDTKFKQAFSIDPTSLTFDNATVTVMAVGRDLFKCKDWNFTTKTCTGVWKKVADLTPGKEYNFTLTAEDPGYGQSKILAVIDKNNISVDINQTILANNSGLLDVEIVSSIAGAKKIKVEKHNESSLNNDLVIDNLPANITSPTSTLENGVTLNTANLDAANVTIENYADASEIYKCDTWNYTANSCGGNWTKVKDTIIGENYSITITSSGVGILLGDPANVTKVDANVSLVNSSNATSEVPYKIKTRGKGTEKKNETSAAKLATGKYDVDVRSDKKTVSFKGLDISSDKIVVKLEDVVKTMKLPNGKTADAAYAIDPTNLTFDTATLTINATGNVLYKCADWDFDAEECLGRWDKVAILVPGQEYSIAINSTDPGFIEGLIMGDVYSNRSWYMRGQNVTLNGSMFEPNKNVTVDVALDDASAAGFPRTVTTDAIGDFNTTWMIPNDAITDAYLVTAVQADNASYFDVFKATVNYPSNISYLKAKEDDNYTAIIDYVNETNGSLLVTFHHDSSTEQPIRIKGRVDYTLTQNSAVGNTPVNLTLSNWHNQFFRIVIGNRTEVLDFGTPQNLMLNATILSSNGTSIAAELNITDPITGTTSFLANASAFNGIVEEGEYRISIKPSDVPIKEIIYDSAYIDSNVTKLVGIDQFNDSEFSQSYALDPTTSQITADATVKVDAVGRDLFKCTAWNFTAETCDGRWKKVADLVPGQEYNFTLSAEDPGFGESKKTVAIIDKDNYLQNTVQTVISNSSGILELNVSPANKSAVKEIKISGHDPSSAKNDLKIEYKTNETGFAKDFWIDPTNLNFTNATITSTAVGNVLYKCTSWNTTTNTCNVERAACDENESAPGNCDLDYGWTIVGNLTPGSDYNIMINATDPGFAEGNKIYATPDNGAKYTIPANEEDVNYGTWDTTQTKDGVCTKKTCLGTGINDPALTVGNEIYQEFAFNLSKFNITGSSILSLTVNLSACWSGGTDGCGHGDTPEFDLGSSGKAAIQIYNGSSWVNVGQPIELGNIVSGTAWRLTDYAKEKIGGFTNSYIGANGTVKIRIKTNGTFFGNSYDVEMFTDYVALTFNTNVTLNASVKDANGNALNTTMEFLSDRDTIAYNSKNSAHNTNVPKGKYKVNVVPENSVVKSITFNDVVVDSDINGIVDIDEPNIPTFNASYAVNPLVSNFTNATITINATANTLYKCASWNFTTRTCPNDDWVKLAENLVVGQLYNITINATDPAFGEINQPDDTAGIDTYIKEDGATTNYGTATTMFVDDEANKKRTMLLYFNVSQIPANARITSAILQLYENADAGATINAEVRRVNQSWTESGATWNTYDGTNSWTTAGGDFGSTVYATTSLDGTHEFKSWNITQLIREWVNGTYTNYGLAVKNASSGGNNEKTFRTSDHTDPTQWPKLTINYTVPLNVTFVSPTPSNASTVNVTYVYVNVSLTNGNATTAQFEWNGVNYTMSNATALPSARWYLNRTNLTNGVYTYKVYANDSQTGVWDVSETRTVTVNADNPPTWSNLISNATASAPRKNEYVNMSVALGDDVNLSRYTFSWNNSGNWTNDSSAAISGTAANVSVSKQVTAAKGSTIGYMFYFNDSLNQTNATNVSTFIVRDTPPTAPMPDQLQNETLTNDNTPTFNWTASTDTDSDTITYRIQTDNNASFASPENESLISATNFTPAVLADGTYYWHVRAETVDANSSYSDSRAFAIDTMPPILSIASPSNTSYNTQTRLVNISSDGANVWYSWNGTNTTYTSPVNVTFAEGTNTLYAYANDTVGNLNSTVVTFTTDTIAPSITIVSPVSAYYNTRTVLADISTSGASNVWYKWNGTNVTYTTSVNVTFAEGVNTLYAYTNDSVGNFNSTSVAFTTDTIVPTISYLPQTPANGSYISSAIVTINISHNETNPASIVLYVDGTLNETRSYSGTYTNFTKTLSEGVHNFSVMLNDSAGNSADATVRTITIDLTNPTLSISYPISNAFIGGSLIEINGTAGDTNAATIVTNDTRFGSNVGTYGSWKFVNTSGITDGFHSVRITANDSAGNSASTIINFTVDNTAPTISLTSPLYDSKLSSQGVSMVGIASDTNAATVTVNDTRFGTNAGSYGNWNFINASLEEGVYSVKITANDSAGNLANAYVLFRIDRTAPTYASMTENPSDPTTYAPGQNYTFGINWTDSGAGVANVTIEFNGVNYTDVTQNESTFSRTFNDLAASTYDYKWHANDNASNTNSTTTQTYTINKSTSSVSLTLNETSGNVTIERVSSINLTASLVNPASGTVSLYENGTLIGLGSSPLTVPRTYNAIGTYDVLELFATVQNYTTSSQTFWITVQDTTPPADVTGLHEHMAGLTWIYWHWTNPTDDDFNHTEVLLDGVWKANLSGDINYYNATGLIMGSNHTISTRTIDSYGNINPNWVNHTTTATSDTQAPTYSEINEPTDPLAYAASAIYNFNATWTDNTHVESVVIEFNGTNYTASEAGSVYYKNFHNLSAGTYDYKWYGTDVSENVNNTDNLAFTVDKANSTLTLSANPSFTTTYGIATSVQCSASVSELTPLLYRNDLAVSNSDVQTLGAGNYSYNCNAATTQNYSAPADAPNTLTVNKAVPTCSLSFNPASPQTYGGTVTTACSCNNPEASAILYRNGNDVTDEIGEPIGMAADSYSYVCNVTQTQNYTSAQASSTYVVNKATPTIGFTINGISSDISAGIYTLVNVTATLTTPSGGGIIRLYENGAYAGSTSTSTTLQRNYTALGTYNWSMIYNGTENYANATASHILTIADQNAPQFSGLAVSQSSPATFSPTRIYEFNSTWTDNVGVDDVLFEFAGINYSFSSGQLNKSGDVYSRTFGPMAAGSYSYRWHANDTNGNRVSTSVQTYVVDKAVAALFLSYSPSMTVTYGSDTSVECNANNGESSPTLTRNSTSVSNPDVHTLAAGSHNYACTAAATQNYTSSSQTGTLTISKATSTLAITMSPSSGVVYGTSSNATCAANNNEVAPRLFLDGVNVTNPHSTTLGTGNHTYSCNASASQNWTSAAATATTLNVARNYNPTNLTINGYANQNVTIYLGDPVSANVTAVAGSISLHVNGIAVELPHLTVPAIGIYEYAAQALGNENYSSNSTTKYLIVKPQITETRFGGTSTNLSALTNYVNISNVIIESSGKGKIAFSAPITINRSVDIDAYVNISSNYVSINSIALPEFNKSATIYVHDLSYVNPKIVRDGSDCPSSICTKVSYSGGTLAFSVAGFSIYWIAEGLYCGDHSCSNGETCSSCPGDCGSCQTPTTQTSSSGGGGSLTATSCSESWYCSEWTNCNSGLQTRTCTDRNKCGSTKSRPKLNQTCTSCTENWVCSEWSACSNSLQTRYCIDQATCNTTSQRPREVQSCEASNQTGTSEPSERNEILIPRLIEAQTPPKPEVIAVTIALLFGLVGVIGLRFGNVSEKMKRMLTVAHVSLVIGVLGLLALTFAEKPVTGMVASFEDIVAVNLGAVAVVGGFGIIAFVEYMLRGFRLPTLPKINTHVKIHIKTKAFRRISRRVSALMERLSESTASKPIKEHGKKKESSKYDYTEEVPYINEQLDRRISVFKKNLGIWMHQHGHALEMMNKTAARVLSENMHLRHENGLLKSSRAMREAKARAQHAPVHLMPAKKSPIFNLTQLSANVSRPIAKLRSKLRHNSRRFRESVQNAIGSQMRNVRLSRKHFETRLSLVKLPNIRVKGLKKKLASATGYFSGLMKLAKTIPVIHIPGIHVHGMIVKPSAPIKTVPFVKPITYHPVTVAQPLDLVGFEKKETATRRAHARAKAIKNIREKYGLTSEIKHRQAAKQPMRKQL